MRQPEMAVPELNEPLTIAQAAQRAGVHPNTVRRLIRGGRLRGALTKGPHGDTWLVDAFELDQLLAGPQRPGRERLGGRSTPAGPPPGPRPWSHVADDEASLPAALDLSLDRARALERYTHGLLTPLVDLLREREASIESREALIRSQASRIGRLEREVELLRERAAGPAPAPVPYPPQATSAAPEAPVSPTLAFTPAVASPNASAVPAQTAMDERANSEISIMEGDPGDLRLPQQVVALAGQMDRLRADLRLMASVLETGVTQEQTAHTAAAVDAVATVDTEKTVELAVTSDPVGAPPPVDPVSPSLTPEEMAGLFPTEARARFGREPLQPLAMPSDPLESDPFAQAEAAVEELRRALSPTVDTGAPTSMRPPDQPEPVLNRVPALEPPAPAPRRRWWSLW
ncbi:MAG TPA: helix-turn-helix domain-containing protein [Chloroflexota bacterium]|nr:helix-turn-helix domain-containing protein [Chloroflexota bacterium]